MVLYLTQYKSPLYDIGHCLATVIKSGAVVTRIRREPGDRDDKKVFISIEDFTTRVKANVNTFSLELVYE